MPNCSTLIELLSMVMFCHTPKSSPTRKSNFEGSGPPSPPNAIPAGTAGSFWAASRSGPSSYTGALVCARTNSFSHSDSFIACVGLASGISFGWHPACARARGSINPPTRHHCDHSLASIQVIEQIQPLAMTAIHVIALRCIHCDLVETGIPCHRSQRLGQQNKV